jgi:hypothetical protein
MKERKRELITGKEDLLFVCKGGEGRETTLLLGQTEKQDDSMTKENWVNTQERRNR